MIKSLSMMPWYPRDFRSSTIGWRLVDKGIYRELLDAQWDLGSLPSDPEELRAISGASEEEWKRAWPKIEPKLPLNCDGRKNVRLEEHRQKALELSRKRSEAGVKAGLASVQSRVNQTLNDDSGKRSANVNHPSPSPSPSPSEEKTKSKRALRASRVPTDFVPDLDFARSQVPDIDAEREAQKFRDWEFKTPRSDWPAAWRTWVAKCRESRQYAKKNGRGEWL